MEKRSFIDVIVVAVAVFCFICLARYELTAEALASETPAPVEESSPQRGLTMIEGPSPDAPTCYVGDNEGFIIVLVKKNGADTAGLVETLSGYGKVIMDSSLKLASVPEPTTISR